jgi:hypothetical protein
MSTRRAPSAAEPAAQDQPAFQFVVSGPLDRFLTEAEWHRVYRQLRRVWGNPYPALGSLTNQGEFRLAQLLAARAPRPARGAGLAAWWQELLDATRAAGITREVERDGRTKRVPRWADWKALRLFVLRREHRMRQQRPGLDGEVRYTSVGSSHACRASYSLVTGPRAEALVEWPRERGKPVGERRRGQRRER